MITEEVETIKRILETGKVTIGSKNTAKLTMTGKPKLIILASNCPKDIDSDIRHYAKLASVPLYDYSGTSIELGQVCRKPFPIAAMAVENPGSANIGEMLKAAKQA